MDAKKMPQHGGGGTSIPGGGARAKVLFVDDERLVLDGLRDSLRRYPFEIASASSADEGFDILASTDIDVVVSDEGMPGMSGSEFLALVCERYPETVRIILSGHVGPATGERALFEGEVFRFVRKPCSAADLAKTILEGLAERDSG